MCVCVHLGLLTFDESLVTPRTEIEVSRLKKNHSLLSFYTSQAMGEQLVLVTDLTN